MFVIFVPKKKTAMEYNRKMAFAPSYEYCSVAEETIRYYSCISIHLLEYELFISLANRQM